MMKYILCLVLVAVVVNGADTDPCATNKKIPDASAPCKCAADGDIVKAADTSKSNTDTHFCALQGTTRTVVKITTDACQDGKESQVDVCVCKDAATALCPKFYKCATSDGALTPPAKCAKKDGTTKTTTNCMCEDTVICEKDNVDKNTCKADKTCVAVPCATDDAKALTDACQCAAGKTTADCKKTEFCWTTNECKTTAKPSSSSSSSSAGLTVGMAGVATLIGML